MSDLGEPKRAWGRYVTPSMLKGYLAGDDHCKWKLWYMGNYDFEKRPEDEESRRRLAQWNKDHDAMVAKKAEELKAEGYTVKLEQSIKVKGVVTVGGRIDIVAIRQEFVLIPDCKSGKKRDADHEQVRLYMFLLPKTGAFSRPLWEDEANEYQGLLVYQDAEVPVDLPPDHGEKIMALIDSVADPNEPERTPERWECKKCKIAKCPDREEDLEGSF